MKKILAAACAAAFLLSAGCTSEWTKKRSEEQDAEFSESEIPNDIEKRRVPVNYSEQTGMWMPYVRFPDYMQGKNEEEFRSAVGRILDDAQAENINTVYFHVHPNGDAYYSSEIYPKGFYLDGGYDPLSIVLDEAHSRGISVHAWINPLRMQSDGIMKTMPDDFVVKKWIAGGMPFVKNVGGTWYLNPAYPEVVELLENTVGELVDNYDVDGVHIDDYFYPTTDPCFDSDAFSTIADADLSAWRTENVSRFVKAMHDRVKAKDGRLLFGISPQGNIDADYASQYADVRRWGSEAGFCDYIVPQIYFGFENENRPFLPTLAQWEELVADSSISLIIGLAAYKLGREDKWAGSAAELEWINNPDIINKQIEAVKKSAANGYALYY